MLLKIKKGIKLTNEELKQLQDGSKYASDETRDPIAEVLEKLRVKYKNNDYNAEPIKVKEKPQRCQKCLCPKFMIISFRSKAKRYWDLFVLILALYNSIMIPLDQAFYPWWRTNAASVGIDVGIDLVFMIDISLMFLTSYIDLKGNEIVESGLIAVNYMQQLRFKIDALALFGSFIFTSIHPFFNIFGMFKVMRVFRISTLISRANVD